jgi:predicted Zn finger-like uncharacterized protein
MDQDFEAECPECGAAVKVTLQAVARERTVRCPHGHMIELKDHGGSARKALSALADLDRTLKRFGQ